MGSSSTTTQRADPWAPAQPMMKQGIEDAQALYNKGGFNISPYGGPMVADYDPMRASADAMTPGQVGAGLSATDAATAAATRAMDPTARSAAWGQVRQNTIDSIMPGINSSFAGSGMTGSELHAQNLAKGLSSGLADVENQAWQQGEDRALAAAGMIPGLNSARYAGMDYMRNAGKDRQSHNQTVIAADMMKDQQKKTSAMNAIQDYMALVSGVGSAFGVQSSTQRNSPGILGMLGLGLQAAPLMFSDRRLKENIKRVGETDDGLGVYTYRYKGSPVTLMGVMAQEVEKVKPEAVGEIGGYKAVDYGAI